jgi:hypothetical protein
MLGHGTLRRKSDVAARNDRAFHLLLYWWGSRKVLRNEPLVAIAILETIREVNGNDLERVV